MEQNGLPGRKAGLCSHLGTGEIGVIAGNKTLDPGGLKEGNRGTGDDSDHQQSSNEREGGSGWKAGGGRRPSFALNLAMLGQSYEGFRAVVGSRDSGSLWPWSSFT